MNDSDDKGVGVAILMAYMVGLACGAAFMALIKLT